jgi:hypothetical protein
MTAFTTLNLQNSLDYFISKIGIILLLQTLHPQVHFPLDFEY